jgi:hypothetical protein
MKMKTARRGDYKPALLAIAAVLGLAATAQAGPPLICHAISIGGAASLPWSSSGQAWDGDTGYDVRNLAHDTLSILDSDPSVLVHMETLRRATIYARRDPRVAKELLTRLYSRATKSDTAGKPDAIAWFDAGYLAESYKEWIGLDLPHMTDGLRNDPNPAAGLDGYAWVKKAIRLRGDDAEMEFAAALITLEGPARDHWIHVRKAIAGANGDALLAENLGSHSFGKKGETIADMLRNGTTAKN